jgi:hypothetical protein
MTKRQEDRLEKIMNRIVDEELKRQGRSGYTGTVSKDYPALYITMLQVVQLYEAPDTE